MKQLDELLSALCGRFGMQIVSQNVTPNQIRLLLRISPQHTRNWLVAGQHMLQAASSSPWNFDLSRHYFLRGQGGVMVWGWRVIFQHEDIAAQIPSIIVALGSAPRARFEVEEQPLPGVTGQRRTMNDRGKGASSEGTPPLLLRMRMGLGGAGQ